MITMSCSICKDVFNWDWEKVTLKETMLWMEEHLHGNEFIDIIDIKTDRGSLN